MAFLGFGHGEVRIQQDVSAAELWPHFREAVPVL
jgi:hypothetical protein